MPRQASRTIRAYLKVKGLLVFTARSLCRILDLAKAQWTRKVDGLVTKCGLIIVIIAIGTFCCMHCRLRFCHENFRKVVDEKGFALVQIVSNICRHGNAELGECCPICLCNDLNTEEAKALLKESRHDPTQMLPLPLCCPTQTRPPLYPRACTQSSIQNAADSPVAARD